MGGAAGDLFPLLHAQERTVSVIDHIEIAVNDATISRHFYEQVLAPLKFRLIIAVAQSQTRTGGLRYGLGPGHYPRLWLHDNDKPGAAVHIAFTAQDRSTVDKFWEAALQAGGKSNGSPGIRCHYHESYYAAYVFDPDGNNIEVVCQTTP
ncbi:Catechol 2,3-dioxygenase [Kosakonia radicincitans]|nr:Catechol 2,3-dioxygenase [Kosakonia radicincitans]